MNQSPDNSSAEKVARDAAFAKHEREQNREFAKLPLPQKLQWLEDASRVARHLQAQSKKSKIERRDAETQRSEVEKEKA